MKVHAPRSRIADGFLEVRMVDSKEGSIPSIRLLLDSGCAKRFPHDVSLSRLTPKQESGLSEDVYLISPYKKEEIDNRILVVDRIEGMEVTIDEALTTGNLLMEVKGDEKHPGTVFAVILAEGHVIVSTAFSEDGRRQVYSNIGGKINVCTLSNKGLAGEPLIRGKFFDAEEL